MKQKLLNSFKLRAVMLVAILCAGFSSAWADTVTFDASKDVTANAQSYQSTEKTYTATDGSVWKANGYGATANTSLVIGKGGANYLETPNVNGTITSVAVTWSGNTSYYLALQTTSGTELEAKNNPSTSTTETFTVSGSYSQLRLVGRRSSGTSNAAATITKVVVTYTTSGGGTPTPTTYTVTYDANGGTGTMTDSNSPYEEGDEVTLLANTFTAPDGKVWDSWSVKDASKNDITVSNGNFTMPASNVTVSAQWVADPNAPQYEWVETGLADLTSSDVFVIVGTVSNSSYSMSNNSTSNPAASSVTIQSGKITSAVNDNIKWNISGNATDGYTFYPNGSTTTWLYCNTTANSGSNTNLRVGTGTNPRKLFIADGTTLKTKDTNTARYWNVYSNGPDWRGYVSNSTSTTVKFYKRQVVSTDPSISADNVNIAYDATGGEFEYSITNPTSATLSATSTDAWITNVTVDGTNSKVTFNTSSNEATTQRQGTITLSYTGATDKVVTITQAAAPVIYTTIPALFAAATSTEAEVKVNFNNWVVSGVSTNGKDVFVTDNAGNGFVIFDNNGGLNNTYAVGSILSGTAVTCHLIKYNGFAEITDLDASDLTITTGGTVTAANVAMANLTGVNTGTLVSYENLTCIVSTSGNYTNYDLTDGTTTIRAYSTLYDFTSTPALENGKTYNITGIYEQFNSTKEILPRSVADIVEVVSTEPTITLASYSVEATAATGLSGTINVTYDNITTVASDIAFYESDGTTTATYDWITVTINSSDNNVEYLMDENNGAARTAYFKVWAYDDNMNEVYSDLISITQSAPMTYVALVAEYNGNYYAVNKSFASKTFTATLVDAVNGKVVNGEIDDISWAITENNGKATIKNKDGSTYIGFSGNDLTTSSSEWTIDNDHHSWKAGTNRYFYYRATANGFRNYSSQNIDAEGYSGYTTAYTFADGYTRTVTGGNWGTICLPKAIAASDFSGVTFYTITGKKMSNGSLEYITASPVTNLQAGYAYLFQADDQATKLIAAYTGDAVNAPVAVERSGTGLQGSFTQTAIPVGGYVLSSGVLYYVDQDDFAYSGQNRAYIDLTNVSEIGSGQVKGVCLFADGVDGVNTMKNEELDSVIFNLAGQRMSKPVKGVNIVNGKKVLVK